MAYDAGLKVGVEGNAEFKRAVREINDELKTMDSALRLVESSYKGQMNSMEALKAKGEALQAIYDKQGEKVRELAAALQNAQRAESEYAGKAAEIKSKLAAAQVEMERLKNSTGDTSKEQKKLAAEIGDLSKALKASEQAQSSATRSVNGWQRELNDATVKLNGLEGELKDNNRYMAEAEKYANKCATSIDRYGKEAKEAATATDDVAQKGNLLTKIFAGGFFANIATQALNAVTRAIKDVALAGLKLASDLQEVQNVVDTTFGDDADKIGAWASSAATAFGLSELNAKQFTGTLGAMLKSSGIVGDELTQMSTTLAGVAADFASFYNLDIEDAFGKIRQAIGGETEGLKQLGINLNQANLMQTEYAKSLNKTWGEMTVAEQATTRYNAILELGSSALGDFSRTSDSFANKLKIVGLQFDNIKLAIGEKLLPIASEALSVLTQLFSGGTSNTAAEKIETLSAGIGKADETLKLIDNYRLLQAELRNSALSEAESAAKTDELNKAKQQLITVSGGVVTALGLENGTFDQQIATLEELTGEYKNLLEQQLASTALANTGEAAEKKKNDLLAESKRLYDEYIEALQKSNEIESEGGLAKFFDGVALFDSTLMSASERAMYLKDKTDELSEALKQMEIDTAAGKEALELLVESCGSVEKAAGLMGITVEDLNTRLSATTISTGELTEAEQAAAGAVDNLKTKLDGLQDGYNEMYKSARDAIDGSIGLWEEMDTSVVKSAKEIQEALDSQIAWLSSYQTNLTALENRKIEGVDLKPLLENLSEVNKDSAAILAGLRNATDEEVKEIVNSLNTLDYSKSSLAGTIADMKSEFISEVDTLMQEAIDTMRQSDAAGGAANETMQGYIKQVYDMRDELVAAHRDVAKAANQAYKDELKIKSPSRVAMDATEDYFDGHILKAMQMIPKMEAAYSEPARKAHLAMQSSIPSVVEQPARDNGAQTAAQIGGSISKALSGFASSGAGRVIDLTFNITEEIDGRQLAKATRKYRIEEDDLAGPNLIE